MVQHSERQLQVNETKETYNGSNIKGHRGNKGTQCLMKNEWTEGEWDNDEIVVKTFQSTNLAKK